MTRRYFAIGFLTFAVAVSTSAPIPVLAADGDLDPTFGIGGRVTYSGASGTSSVIQSDGKIIVAGSIGGNPNSDFLLVRYNRDGSLDTAFGLGGKVTTDFAGQQDGANALAIQPDGKILAVGASRVTEYRSDFALARYKPDGSLDTTFGVGGKMTTNFSGLQNSVVALALQPDGKIVAAGLGVESLSPSNIEFAVVRYNADGSLDKIFGLDGKASTDFSGRGGRISAVSIQPDGKIVAAGMTSVPPSPGPYSGFLSGRGALVRFNHDGSLDTTFGSGGRVVTNVLGTSEIRALVIQSDGKIIAGGTALSAPKEAGIVTTSKKDFALVRFNNDGASDLTFGTQGKVTTSLGSWDVINAVALQPDGKIIAAGDTANDYGVPAVGLARYNRDGSLDTTFGIDGTVREDLPQRSAFAHSIGIQSDGKIVVTGIGETYDECGYMLDAFFELARYDTTGLQIVSAIRFDPVVIRIGGSWNVTLSGSNLTDRTHFDVRFRNPGSTKDQVALNWQQGTSAGHSIETGTEAGTWIVTGVRAHENLNDHGGEFAPVSASITVTGG